MKEMINVVKSVIGEESDEVNAVDARELHGFLGSRRDFSNWIKDRIKKYNFVQGIDFIRFNKIGESEARKLIEYTLSIDMAKEISMIEHNAKGKEARQYFIACEKELNQIKKVPLLPKDFFEMEMIGVKMIGEMLSYSKPSMLQIVNKVYEDHNLSTKSIPQFVEDTRSAFSATDMLKEFKCELKAGAFNKLAIADGYIEVMKRTLKGGKIKKFNSLTEKGKEYGQNDSSKFCPQESIPHYFKDSFVELYSKLTNE